MASSPPKMAAFPWRVGDTRVGASSSQGDLLEKSPAASTVQHLYLVESVQSCESVEEGTAFLLGQAQIPFSWVSSAEQC